MRQHLLRTLRRLPPPRHAGRAATTASGCGRRLPRRIEERLSKLEALASAAVPSPTCRAPDASMLSSFLREVLRVQISSESLASLYRRLRSIGRLSAEDTLATVDRIRAEDPALAAELLDHSLLNDKHDALPSTVLFQIIKLKRADLLSPAVLSRSCLARLRPAEARCLLLALASLKHAVDPLIVSIPLVPLDWKLAPNVAFVWSLLARLVQVGADVDATIVLGVVLQRCESPEKFSLQGLIESPRLRSSNTLIRYLSSLKWVDASSYPDIAVFAARQKDVEAVSSMLNEKTSSGTFDRILRLMAIHSPRHAYQVLLRLKRAKLSVRERSVKIVAKALRLLRYERVLVQLQREFGPMAAAPSGENNLSELSEHDMRLVILRAAKVFNFRQAVETVLAMRLRGFVIDSPLLKLVLMSCKRSPRLALTTFITLVECGAVPDAVAFNALMASFVQAGDLDGCEHIIGTLMPKHNVLPDAVTYASITRCCGLVHNTNALLRWTTAMEKAGFDSWVPRLHLARVSRHSERAIELAERAVRTGLCYRQGRQFEMLMRLFVSHGRDDLVGLCKHTMFERRVPMSDRLKRMRARFGTSLRQPAPPLDRTVPWTTNASSPSCRLRALALMEAGRFEAAALEFLDWLGVSRHFSSESFSIFREVFGGVQRLPCVATRTVFASSLARVPSSVQNLAASWYRSSRSISDAMQLLLQLHSLNEPRLVTCALSTMVTLALTKSDNATLVEVLATPLRTKIIPVSDEVFTEFLDAAQRQSKLSSMLLVLQTMDEAGRQPTRQQYNSVLCGLTEFPLAISIMQDMLASGSLCSIASLFHALMYIPKRDTTLLIDVFNSSAPNERLKRSLVLSLIQSIKLYADLDSIFVLLPRLRSWSSLPRQELVGLLASFGVKESLCNALLKLIHERPDAERSLRYLVDDCIELGIRDLQPLMLAFKQYGFKQLLSYAALQLLRVNP